MGIRGLTTFINNRSHLYLQGHKLHDSDVVIDGNSLASNLYKWHCKSNDCFGGDYDKFAHVIRNFFDLLSQCNITPYVILDGGYEKRKLNTVISRMKNKIRAAGKLNAVTEGSESVFPLFLREVFVDIVVRLKIKVARCEFEGDMEIAGIARALECPVISYDSDFFIFGCLYIPFSTVDLTARRGKDLSTKTPYTYILCEIYHVENFLQSFGGLDRNNLPILAVLLGNDYIKGSLFSPFFRNLKIQKCSGSQSDQQKRIKSVIVWLQNEDIESAIRTVLGRFKDARRQLVLKKIQEAMKGYFEVNSELLRYLNIDYTRHEDVDLQVDFNKLNNNHRVCAVEKNNSTSDNNSSDCEVEENHSQRESEPEENIQAELYSDLERTSKLSKIFQKKYRSCQYPACFMDMIILNRYYCVPQVEDCDSEHSHAVSLGVLNIIYKILTSNLDRRLKIVCRSAKNGIRYSNLPRSEVEVPTLEAIENFTVDNQKHCLLNLLSIDNEFSQILKSFPIEWHLFLVSLKYAVDKGSFDNCVIYSCLMCFIILHYIDTKVGFYRVSKTFDKKFAQSLLKIKTEDPQKSFQSFDNLPFNECLVFMDKMIIYFQMDSKLKSNHRLYDKVLVHSLSQIQSIFLHMKYLNSILNNPLPILEIHRIFDGTFLYNMTMNLRKRSNISDYLELFLKDCPCILDGIKNMLVILDPFLKGENFVLMPPVKKHKKKKRKLIDKDAEPITNEVEDEKIEATLDPNNPYSLLAVM